MDDIITNSNRRRRSQREKITTKSWVSNEMLPMTKSRKHSRSWPSSTTPTKTKMTQRKPKKPFKRSRTPMRLYQTRISAEFTTSRAKKAYASTSSVKDSKVETSET